MKKYGVYLLLEKLKLWWKKNSRKAKRVCSFIRKFRVGTMYIIRRSFNYAYFLSYAYWFQEWRIGAHHSSFNLLHTSCNRIECCIFGHHCHGGGMHHIMGQNNFWSTGYGKVVIILKAMAFLKLSTKNSNRGRELYTSLICSVTCRTEVGGR